MRILDNGVYRIGKRGAGEITLLGSGTFGGATVTIGYLTVYDDDSTFQALAEAEATVAGAFSITFAKGSGTDGAVEVTGGTGVDIEIVDNSV